MQIDRSGSPLLRITILRTLAVLFIGIAIMTSTSCATHAANQVQAQRSPLEQAKLNYVTGAMDYDFSLKVVRELRAARLVSDTQWTRVEKAVAVAQEWAPLVEHMLTVWEQYCSADACPPPPNFNDAEARLGGAFNAVVTVRNEVRK